MSTTILSSATTSATAVVANPVQSTSSHPTTATNTASNVDVAEGDHHHHDNEDSSSSVGADVASVHSHRSFHSDNEDEDACSEADADGAQTNVDDDTHTQYYETNGSYTHGSIPTTHFGASLPAELMDLSGHGHGFGHSGSPPAHHIHSMFMGTTAPSAPQHATLADVILCGSDFPVAPTPPSSGHAMPSGSEASRSISAASGASKTLATPAAAPRSPSEEARALEARQTQRRAKIGVRFKTKHCHTFQESGECRYGDSCVFAHGEEELAKYVAIADAAELAAAGGVEGAVDVPTAASAPAPSKKTTSKPDAVPAKSKVVASSSPVATSTSTAPAVSVVAPDASTTTNKYRDALMKSVPAPASSTTAATAAKPVNTTVTTTTATNNVVASSTTPPRSPTSSVPFNSKLTALQLHHHMTQHIPAASDQKRCNDYGFGANVRDERQRASEGNRRVPQEELERYRLERKAEAIARARMSDAGSSASPSPAPEGHNNNDFYMRQASGGFNHHYERSVSSQNSMSEHFESAAAALVSDSALASPVANDERRFPGMAAGVPTNSHNLDIILNPTSTPGYGTRSNASSTSNGNYYANPNADASAALHVSGSWDYVHRQQPAPKSPGAASGASSGRYSHNPYNVGRNQQQF